MAASPSLSPSSQRKAEWQGLKEDSERVTNGWAKEDWRVLCVVKEVCRDRLTSLSPSSQRKAKWQGLKEDSERVSAECSSGVARVVQSIPSM